MPWLRAAVLGTLGLLLHLSQVARINAAGTGGGVKVVETPPRLFVLSVGINKFPKGGKFPDSLYSEADANSVAEVFSDKNPRLAMQVFTRRLVGAAATQAAIRGTMQDIARTARPTDVFLFFMASMSGTADGEYIFPASDTLSIQGGKTERAIRGSDLATLLLEIPARRQIVILDGCDSQLAADSIRDALQPKGSFQLDALRREVAIFTNRGTAYEVPQIGHGILTYSLLQGLQGGADVDRSGVITEARLEGYLAWKVPETSKQLGLDGPRQQHFYSYSTMNNLPLMQPRVEPRVEARVEPPKPAVADDEEPTRSAGQRASVVAASTDLGKDYALIVATDHYSDGVKNLSNPIFDAKALRDELIQDYGYDPQRITELYDVKKADFRDAVLKLREQKGFGPNDRLLVYVAGHGTRDPIDGYMMFADSQSAEHDRTQNSLLGFGTLRGALDVIPVPHILLIMDVCYGGTFDGLTATHTKTRFQSVPEGAGADLQSRMRLVHRMLEVNSRIYITSTDEDHVASDGHAGEHSPFSKALLAKLKQRGGEDHLVDIGSLYGSLHLTLPVEPRAGYFDIGGAEQNASFVLIPSDAMTAQRRSLETRRNSGE